MTSKLQQRASCRCAVCAGYSVIFMWNRLRKVLSILTFSWLCSLVCVLLGVMETLQKWRSILVISALMVAGCLLLLHLHVVDSLVSYASIRDIQGDITLLELPVGSRVIVNGPAQQESENQAALEGGIPEQEMANKLDPNLKPEPEPLIEHPVVKPNASWCKYQDLAKALKEVSSNGEIYILVIPDVNHIRLAENSLMTLARRTKKNNLLFMCRDAILCEATREKKLPCYIDESYPGSSAPVYGAIHKALQEKYKVIYMDFETSIIKQVPATSPSAGDVVAPYGRTPKVHSFFVAHSTPAAQRFFSNAIQDSQKNLYKPFAAVFRSVLDNTIKKKIPFKLAKLANCMRTPVDTDCSVLRHPNFNAAADRTLWLKEKQMWFSDTDGYYTNPNAMYLCYENDYNMGKRTIEYEIHALKNALAYGRILKRTVILPKFLCPTCVGDKCKLDNCLLHQFLNLTKFDVVFGNLYREHSFRGHPLVPIDIKKSISDLYLIQSPLHQGMLKAGGEKIPSKNTATKVIVANNIHEGPDSDEVLDLFESASSKFKILRFVNLYGAFSGFTSAEESLQFEMKLKQGIMTL